MVTRILVLGVTLSMFIMPMHGAAATAAVLTSAEISQEIVIQNVTAREGSVSGTVVNKSSQTVRDVALLIRDAWLWDDERHPGTDSPGRTGAFTLRQDVAPHTSASFTFQTPPLTRRSGGRFVTTVEVTGFSDVGL